MKIFDSIDELWLHAGDTLLTEGKSVPSRDGGSTEIIGFSTKFSGQLLYPSANFLFNPVRLLSPSYAAAETLWYLSGSQSIDMIESYAKQYRRFAPDGIANGAYGYRWKYGSRWEVAGHFNQIDKAIELLKSKPQSRQVVLSMFESKDLHRAESTVLDVPCTETIQLLIRENELHMIVNMRSNDIWLGMPYDIFAFTTLQQLLALHLGVGVGEYTHNVGSLHVYDRNLEKFKLAMNPHAFSVGGGTPNKRFHHEVFWDQIESALAVEAQLRSIEAVPFGIDGYLTDSLAELVRMCAVKHTKEGKHFEKSIKEFTNPLMAQYVEKYWSPED